MGHVLSLEAARKDTERAQADAKRRSLENRLAIAVLREPDEDASIIYNLVNEYGIEAVCNMLERNHG